MTKGAPWLAVATLVAAAALSGQDAAVTFSEANELFQQGNDLRSSAPDEAAEMYRRAALRYERLTEGHGIRTAQLYYNLGNAYFLAGDIGRAILNYRRAQRLNPSDGNIARNLEFSRSQRQDKLEPEPGGQALRTLLFWHFDWSRSTRVRTLATAWVVLWLVLLLRLVGQRWAPREIAMAMAATIVLLVGSLAYDAMSEARTVAGVVVIPETIARQGDSHSYEPAFREALHAGAEFSVLEQRPGWCRVELPDGRLCWLDSGAVELVR